MKSGHEAHIAGSLERSYRKARRTRLETTLSALKLVLVSDAHKGGGDRADEFRRAERAYNAALGYYAEEGFTLAVLGDGEELWKYHPEQVLDSMTGHRRALVREAEFHARGRYIRLVGNHDGLWRSHRNLEKHLGDLFPGLAVHDAIVICISDDTDGHPLGELFLVHGSQAALDGALLAWVSCPVLHYVVGPLQRAFGFSVATPAINWTNRTAHHEEAMSRWAARRRVVLIAGHTHRPIFPGSSPQPALDRRPDEIAHALETTSNVHARAGLRADLEYALAEIRRVSPPAAAQSPCYFNTGACYGDGDLTAIEISDGRIRLVRWPGGDPHPRPNVLKGADRSLREVLRDVDRSARRSPAEPLDASARRLHRCESPDVACGSVPSAADRHRRDRGIRVPPTSLRSPTS